MATIPEQLSNILANSQGKPDSNLAQDSNNLGGVPAEEYATKEYVREYHNDKESSQKEYIDSQDEKILEQAKEYANSQIRNQDFSGFAKVTDVQALDKKLQEKITEGDNTQQTYTDQKIKQVVDDANSNFSNISGNINTINGNINTMNGQIQNLFQSVSDGKNKIAGAITDKGVVTSADASFDTMATNIRAIPTSSGGGGGDIPEGYYNTSDANISASDVVLGKIGYGANGKVIGALTQIPGTGIDTSNATATAGDIAKGKTAYARGQFLVGTMNTNPEVTEIYAPNISGFEVIRGANYIGEFTYGDADAIDNSSHIAYSKDMNYAIRIDFLTKDKGEDNWANNTKFVIDVFRVGTGGLILEMSAGSDNNPVYRKFRYTKEELGIGENETVTGLAIGSTGLLSYPTLSLCYLTTQDGTNKYLHVYTFNQTEQGILLKANGSTAPVVNIKYPLPNVSTEPPYWRGGQDNPFTPNTYPDVCCMNLAHDSSGRYYAGIRWVKVSLTYTTSSTISTDIFIYDDKSGFEQARGALGFTFTKNDEYLLPYGTSSGNSDAYVTIAKINRTDWTPNIKAIGSINSPSSSSTLLPEEEFTAKPVGFTVDYSEILDRILITRGLDLSIYNMEVVGDTINFILEKTLRIRWNRQ